MKKTVKKGLAILLSVALVTGILPQMSYPKEAKAAEKEWPGNPHKEEYWNLTIYDCVYFGNYWYHDTNKDGKTDKSDAKEPIKWRVLSVDEESGDAFLLADRIVDAQVYSKTDIEGVTWENCTLRSWLNGYGSSNNADGEDYSGTGESFFDNAFSEEEKNAIIPTTVKNEDNSVYNTPGGNDTTDKVYLLSISEVTDSTYGFNNNFEGTDDSRESYATDYAISVVAGDNNLSYDGVYYWYLRSPGSNFRCNSSAAFVYGNSRGVGENLGYAVNQVSGVRPVLHLNLKNENVWVPACSVEASHYTKHSSFGPWQQEDTEGSNGRKYHIRICTNETCVRLDPYNSYEETECSGGTAGYTKKAVCTVCGGEYGVLLTDDTPPTGKIRVGTDQWDDVLTNFTYERFYKESKDVTITAEDGESGVASISYYLTDSELSKDDLEAIESWQQIGPARPEEEDWLQTDTATVTISPDTESECILYAKIVDRVGNTTYLSTDGMVFDGTAPKIEGVDDKGTYCASQDVTVTVTDKYLDSVTLDGQNVSLSEGGNSCTLPLSGAEHSQTINATDKAGNSATVTVTVNKDHSYGAWYGEPNQNRSRECEICHEVYEETDEERMAAAAEIVEKVLDGLTVTNDTTKESLEKQIQDALAEAGFWDVTVTVEDDFNKKPATEEAEGSLTGTVTITKGEENDSVSINKIIARLSQDSTGDQTGKDNTGEDNTVTTPGQQETNKVGLIAELKVTQKGKKIQIKWGKVADADGYQVYVQYCGKKFSSKPTKTVKSVSTTKVTVAKIKGKKLNLKKNFKVYVAAYKKIDGKKVVTKKTMTAHIVGKNNRKYTNVKKVKVSKKKYTLKAGKTVKIKAKIVLVDKKKKRLSNAHGKKFRYKSTDTSVATVSKKGKITAVGKGTCSVYVFSQNGCAKKIKVTIE